MNIEDVKTIAVIGAGGDRDRAKRPLMGAAGSAADLLFVTSDNPRTEDPAAIRAEILSDASNANEIGDRREAISLRLGPGPLDEFPAVMPSRVPGRGVDLDLSPDAVAVDVFLHESGADQGFPGADLHHLEAFADKHAEDTDVPGTIPARFRAGASFTPSPMTATVSPSC